MCHLSFRSFVNGVTPPSTWRVKRKYWVSLHPWTDSTLDPDLGYYGVIGVDSYKYAFKIPTIRNINKTAPYMHNGVYRTLDQVMEFYNNGGAMGLGIHLSNQRFLKKVFASLKKKKRISLLLWGV